MTAGRDDYHDFVEHKRFLGLIEQGIREANRRIIGERIPSLDQDAILTFAVAIGRLRARYLETAFKLGIDDQGDPPDQSEIAELRMRREMFQEARAAFDALREAIERGYIDIGALKAKGPPKDYPG